ncbi:MAG: hypothetical protein QGH83_11885 [Candidatus Pacebacteria bacterium]|jgi:hypothetical protein|nr:hypothetical protein [Candidatus Paceibacterota bacterium]|tara:strand:- start:16 stop:924 length:909 start_codon:yes stop_codon:yes gene_type:complete
MTTNVYFSKGTPNEQHLYEDLAIEAIQIYGHDVFYIPRTLVNKDELFGESALSRFDDAYGIEMWMETQEGYEGEKELVSRFGLEIRDETTFVVSRRRWDNTVSNDANLIVSSRPDEGDLVYMPTVKKLFEISFVDHDDPFYQVDNLPVYKLYCRTFEYSSEVLDTGIAAIDDIETQRSTDFLGFEISGEQASGVIFNENIGLEWGTIYATGDGDVMQEDGTTNPNTVGDNLLGENEEGFAAVMLEDSDDYYTFVVIQEAYSLATQDTQSENEWFEDRVTGIVGDPVLDFTESNPFGDPTESI